MSSPAYQPIEAAGAVLWKRAGDQELVALVHRPAYDDWSLPKGKARRGEHPILVALREVHEETGYRGVLGVPLPDQRYLKEERPKVVHLHAMEARSGEPLDPEVEVDAVRWLPLTEAIEAATWERDRISLTQFAGAHRPTSVVMLLRHASAGDRKQWEGDDLERPLDGYGEEQAAVLAEILEAYAFERVISSPATRCVQTVSDFAGRANLDIELALSMSEDAYDHVGAELLIDELVSAKGSTLVCSHGPVLIDVIERIAHRLELPPTGAARVPKGGAWLVHTDRAGQVVDLERLPAA